MSGMLDDETLPVVDDWFKVEQIDADLAQVSEPHVSGLVSANIWWLRGGPNDLVIDTGVGVASLRAHLPQLFARDPMAVITHTHLDHVGGAHEFRHVAVHEAELLAVASPAPASLDPATELQLLGIELEEGAHLPSSLLHALPDVGYDPDSYSVRPSTVTRVLHDGDTLDVGETIQVLHLPGHSPGSIALWDPSRCRLFTGDVIYEGELLDQMHGTDIRAYVNSMRRLLELPVDVVYPGHGQPFSGSRLREIATNYIDRRAHFLEMEL